MKAVKITVTKDGASTSFPWSVTLLTEDNFRLYTHGFKSKKSAIINQVATWVSQCTDSAIEFEGLSKLEYQKTMLNHQMDQQAELAELKRMFNRKDA